MRSKCLYCEARLVPNPNGRWAHCPTCEPEFARGLRTQTSYNYFKIISGFSQDTRGRPGLRPA